MSGAADSPSADDVARMAAILGLSIDDAASRAAVAEHLAALLAAARLLAEFPLPDAIDAAPVFRP